MWMLSFIPDAWIVLAVHAITLVGVTCIVLATATGWIPGIKAYASVIRIIGIVLLCLGIYFEGGMGVEKSWRARVAEMEEKVRQAELKSQQANTAIETHVVEKTKVIREKGKIQIEYVNRIVKGDTVEIVKDMSEEQKQEFLTKQKELQDALKNCPIPKIIVEEHNKATEMQ